MARRRSPRRRGPLPLRVRLTLAVASATAVVLAVTGILVFGQFSRGLDSRTDAELRERGDGITSLARQVPADQLLADAGESLAQLYGRRGELVATTRILGPRRLLTPTEVRDARRRPTLSTLGKVAGTDDGARVRAFGVRAGRVVAIAEASDGREQELRRLATLLGVGLPFALLLAAFTGYQVAGAALRPVERIRSSAERIGETDVTQRLPEPGTGDELDRLTRTLNDLLARLADALEHERRIVSDASHELRTPISVLRTRIDVALRGEPDAAALREVLEGAQGDAVRLARLADDLLVLARADQGRLPLRPEPIDVQDLLEQTALRHEAAASASGRTVRATVAIEGGAVVLADPDRLAQALDNLVVNALHHGAGVVDLTARAPDPGFVEVTVGDSGAGFPEALLARAFDRFSQGQESHQGGAGLGLAIVAALARASGGTARASNRSDGGAEVTLVIPAA